MFGFCYVKKSETDKNLEKIIEAEKLSPSSLLYCSQVTGTVPFVLTCFILDNGVLGIINETP